MKITQNNNYDKKYWVTFASATVSNLRKFLAVTDSYHKKYFNVAASSQWGR